MSHCEIPHRRSVSYYPRSALRVLREAAKTFLVIIRTTTNFWDALALIFEARVFRNQDNRAIVFRNGTTVSLSWPEYVAARRMVDKGYTVGRLGEFLLVERDKIKLVGPADLVGVGNERLDRIYKCECKNKVVLDVGGFIGDTAVLFSTWGARKIIVYEPVIFYHEFIKMNLMLNGIDAELHEEGIADRDGYNVIRYNTLDCTFGLRSKGIREITIRVRDVASVIQESHAEIAKFDCEGAEKSLLGVNNEILRLIGTYLIEVHDSETKESLVVKFQDAGFVCTSNLLLDQAGGISVVTFKRR